MSVTPTQGEIRDKFRDIEDELVEALEDDGKVDVGEAIEILGKVPVAMEIVEAWPELPKPMRHNAVKGVFDRHLKKVNFRIPYVSKIPFAGPYIEGLLAAFISSQFMPWIVDLIIGMIAKATKTSSSVNPPSLLRDVGIFAFASLNVVGPIRVEIEWPLGAGAFITVRISPRIVERFRLVDIGPVPGHGSRIRLGQQSLQSLLFARVGTIFEPIDIKRCGQIINLNKRDIGLGRAKNFHKVRHSDHRDQRQDRQHDQDFK